MGGQDVLCDVPPLNVWVVDEADPPAVDTSRNETPSCFACWGVSSSQPKPPSLSAQRQETPGVDSRDSRGTRRRVSVKIKDQKQEQQTMRDRNSGRADPQTEKAREKARRRRSTLAWAEQEDN